MTKREMYNEMLKVSAVAENEDMVAFIQNEIKLLDKKKSASRKPTKTQVENEGFKADIVASLIEVDKPVTIKELCAVCPSIADLTNQRITHLLTALVKDGKVVRTQVKKVAYFSYA